ncbi:MAG: hypothetical protein RLO18_11840 [Gimesia chilikensis]
MSDSEKQFEHPEPSWRVYTVAFLVAAIGAFGICSFWLLPQAAAIAACIAGIAAVLGVFMTENIGEAIFFSLIIGLLVTLMPKTFWSVITVLPIGIGLCIGKICVGVWKERN